MKEEGEARRGENLESWLDAPKLTLLGRNYKTRTPLKRDISTQLLSLHIDDELTDSAATSETEKIYIPQRALQLFCLPATQNHITTPHCTKWLE